MRKFSKILALLLAVSLVGGMFALTASATDETLVVSGTGAGGATPSMNRYYTFSGSDAAPTKTSTKYGNIFQPNGFYTYATNEIVTDASGNTYYKASGSGAPAANMYAFISGSPDLAGAKMTDYSSEAELVNNVVITEFDICAFDVDGDGYADWDGLRLLGGYVAYSANAAKADAKIAQPFSTLITDTTPGKWHHISLIATARPVSDDESYPGRVDVAVLVDGVHFGTYNFNSGYCATDTAGVEMVYYHIGAAKAASYMSGDWSIGLDNFVVNAYNKASYANADADTNTIAYLMSQGSYTAFSVIGVGDNAPLSSYSDSAYYTETYDPFDPNPAVATVDGVKYTSLDAALANLTDGKTLETALNVENYTPGDVTCVNIKAPVVTLSDAARAAGFVTATWNDTLGNTVMTTVCKPGAEATPPTIDPVTLADEDNPYRDWCTSAIGYSTEAVVINEDVVLTPDSIVPVEAKVKGIRYNVNLDTSFDIVVYAPLLYVKNADGEFELSEALPEGLEFDSISAQKYATEFDSYQPVEKVGDVIYYSPAVYCPVSMRKLSTEFVPEIHFTVNGVEMTYTMPAITIGSYANAVYAMEGLECGSDEFVLITAMLNYCKSYEYENLTSNGTPNKATFAIYAAVNSKQNNDDLTPGAHYDCACQDALKTYANAPTENELANLNTNLNNSLVLGATMHINYNEPAIALEVQPDSIGHYAETAGQGLINAYRYTYTNYLGQEITQTVQITSAASNGGWDNYVVSGDVILLKCANIDVIDVLGEVTIELLTTEYVTVYDEEGEPVVDENGEEKTKLQYSVLGNSVTYSVAEYYDFLNDDTTQNAQYIENLKALYNLVRAAKEYRMVKN